MSGFGDVFTPATAGRAASVVHAAIPLSRFVVVSGGLVQDTLTSLVWQQQPSTTTMSLADAQTYCSSAGSGFRLPTLKELLSIVDLTVTSGPPIDQTAFPNTPEVGLLVVPTMCWLLLPRVGRLFRRKQRLRVLRRRHEQQAQGTLRPLMTSDIPTACLSASKRARATATT
jgi:hypothetical protein